MKIINVGMGEVQVSNSQSVILVAPGLGSCIGLTMYDPINKIAGMVHIVLPDSTSVNKEITLPGKYADTAVPYLLDLMIKAGANKGCLIVKIAGGAQMFNLEKGGNILNIGMRNIIAAKTAVTKSGLVIKEADTGGNRGRTLRLEVATGQVFVRSLGQNEVAL